MSEPIINEEEHSSGSFGKLWSTLRHAAHVEPHAEGAISLAIANINLISNLRKIFLESNEDLEKTDKELYDKIGDEYNFFIEIAKKLQKAKVEQPQAAVEDVLSEEEVEQLNKIFDEYNYCTVRQEEVKAFKTELLQRGIPTIEAAAQNSEMSVFYFNRDNAREINSLKRFFNIQVNRMAAGKVGFTSDKEFKQRVANETKIQLQNVPAYKVGLIEMLMAQNNLYGGKGESNTDRNDQKFNLYFRSCDEVRVQKVLLEAEFMDAALSDQGTDLLLKNMLQAKYKDERLLTEALEASQFTDFYICAETTNMYMKVTKDGLEFNSGSGEHGRHDVVDRNDPKFEQMFRSCAQKIMSHNMIVIPETDFKNDPEKLVEGMKTFKGRKNLFLEKHASGIDYVSFNQDFMNSLKRNKYKTAEELASDKQKTLPYAILEALKENFDKIPETHGEPMDLLDNKSGEASVIQLIQEYGDYAVAFAKNEEYNRWLHSSLEERQNIEYTDAQVEEIKQEVSNAKQKLDATISALKSTYGLSEETVNNLSTNIAETIGAEVDASGKIEFSKTPEAIEDQIKQVQKMEARLYSVRENMSKEILAPFESLEDKISRNDMNREDLEKQDLEELGAR